MKQMGVLLRHFDASRLCQYNRITVGSREQMEIFVLKLKEVLEVLGTLEVNNFCYENKGF
jgi:histidinol-phosphate aminotransferase